ncbi:MAG: hypothetical protein AAGJ79_01455 [Verrucomicrobiota bacterium]
MSAKTKVILAIPLLLLVTAGIILWTPVKGAVDQWRSSSLLKDAQHELENGNPTEALRSAHASFQLNPTYKALRLQFLSLQELKHPQRLLAARQLALHEEASHADVAKGFAAILAAKDFRTCQIIIDQLPESHRNSPEIQEQFVRYLAATKRLQDAITVMERIEASPWRERAVLVVGDSLSTLSNPASRGAGIQLLNEVLRAGEAADAEQALTILSSLPAHVLTKDNVQDAIERFATAESPPTQITLNLEFLRWASSPPERTQIVDRVIETHLKTGGDALSLWLLKVGEYQEVIDFTDSIFVPDPLTTPYFIHRTNALAQLRRFDRLALELTRPPKGLPRLESLAFQAGAARIAGKSSEENSFWQRAYEQAGSNQSRNDYYRLAEIAKRFEATEWEFRALASAIEQSIGIPPPVRDLKPVLEWIAKSDMERLLRVCRRLLLAEPTNVSLLNNVSYLTCLLEGSDAEHVETLKKLAEKYPRVAGLRGSLALAQFQTDDFPGARITMENMGIRPESMNDPQRAICAAILHHEQRVEPAEGMERIIRWGTMSTVEQEFFRKLLLRAKGSRSTSVAPAGLPPQ